MQRDIRRASERALPADERRGVYHAIIDRETRILRAPAVPCRGHFFKVIDCRDLRPVPRQETRS